ncbi:hypothetical protein ACFL6M_06185, partial [Candidatus Eisenbacteria bacterium]
FDDGTRTRQTCNCSGRVLHSGADLSCACTLSAAASCSLALCPRKREGGFLGVTGGSRDLFVGPTAFCCPPI